MENNKNIAVVCNYELNPNRIGGMDRFFKSYNEELKAKGHKVKWFFCGKDIPEFYKGFDIHLANDCLVEEKTLGFLKTENPFDIVVTHFTALCTSFYRDLKRNGVERIVAVDHNPRPLQDFPLKKRLKNKAKGMLYGKYIDAFIGVSEYTKQYIIKDYGRHVASKTVVVHNGIDYKNYIQKDASTRKNKKFIVVSHLRPSKGIQDLIKALTLLTKEEKKQISIDVFGEGFYEEELKKMTVENKLENIISFFGSKSDLPHKIHQYDYLLQPTHMECFSLSLLESIAANVPVVTTTVGGNMELIENNKNGFVFEPKDKEALAGILKDIISGKKSIKGDVHSIIAQKFSLENMLKEHVKMTLCT